MIDADESIGLLVGGRYRLVEKLGAGGFGRVWRARDETLGIDVAVKEVRLPETLSRREAADRLERARREARHAARLRDHPNVVAVHDVVVQDGVPWTVMQLIPGRTLDAHLADRGPLRPADAAVVARALLSALRAAHTAGIVHRDVKPANVMLTPDREVVLTDFGLAVAEADTSLTATGSVMGSMEYLAPERAEGRDGMPASDLFSLGATLYQAVEGVSPFRRETATATLKAVLLDEPPRPARAGALGPVIDGLLVKDPGRRLGIDDALEMLESAVLSATTEALAPLTRRAERAEATRRAEPQLRRAARTETAAVGPEPGPAGRRTERSGTGLRPQTTAMAPMRSVPARQRATAWSKAMPWVMAGAGLVVAVVVGACTHQVVHSYRGTLRTLNKPAPGVLPGVLISTVAAWVLAAVVVDRVRPSGRRSAPRRSAAVVGYGLSGLALVLGLLGALGYDRKVAAFNKVMENEARGPWTEAHAAAVVWLLPLFAVVYLIVYWNVESAGRVDAASPRGAGRR